MISLPIADMDAFQKGVTEAWKSINVATVNGSAVRFRVMQDTTANWHKHDEGDELFYVVSGVVFIDTHDGAKELRPGQLIVVPAGTRHRARVEGRATLLVIDGIRELGK